MSEEIALDKNIKHTIEVVIDRLVIKPGIERRLTDSCESALALSGGLLSVDIPGEDPLTFSQSFSCPDCGISIDEIEPRSFSFNNPFGACPDCLGLGYKMEFDIDLVIPDKSLSIHDGAIAVPGWQSVLNRKGFAYALLKALGKEYGFDLDTPFGKYPKKVQKILIDGTGGKEVKVHYRGQRGVGVYDIAFDGLIRSSFGVPEPPEDPERLADEDDILLLMPGLAFDRAHNRVGYGGGFYDRYIERKEAEGARFFKPALAYGFQIVDSIPSSDHDVRVDAILTAEEIL